MSDPIDDILPGLNASPQPARRSCPVCKRPVDPNAKAFPFCTPRCKTVDLAKWATGDYKFSRPIQERDLDIE